tara:strand:+ start:2540 stop:2851 length:312 start_codon:yes stop_codon:yes gene_type:complete
VIAAQDQQTPLSLKFYVAGDGIFTRNAIANLKNLVSGLNQNADAALLTEVEVIDVTQAPSVALELGIFTTPTLIVSSTTKKLRFVGDISDPQKIIEVLESDWG